MNNPRLTRRDFLKAAGIGTASMLVGGGAASAAKIAGSKGRKPNIVFILADGLFVFNYVDNLFRIRLSKKGLFKQSIVCRTSVFHYVKLL
jgi:hypothetical protein